MIDNILLFERKDKGGIAAAPSLEFQRFADGSVIIEASDKKYSDIVAVELSFDEVKQLAEFLGGLIGIVSA